MKNNKLKIIKKIINGKYYIDKLNISSRNYNFYIETINNIKKQRLTYLSYKDILAKISESIYIKKYLNLIVNIKEEKLYKSHLHGINHNIRVSIFALIISIYENISLSDFKIIIEATKYHDIGRINDNEDKEHGLRSSQSLNFLKKYNDIEINYLKTIIQCHSLNDDLFDEIALKNNVNDIERCRKMLNILKDADALDRVRLEWPKIKIELIRTETAKKLIPFAYELFEYYEYNLEEINE